MAIIPTWSSLRTIGRSRLARATVFIPIVGYFVIFNEELTKYLHLIPRLAGTGSATQLDDLNLTRIISLYVGLFCLGIASIIFHLFCPRDISDSASEHEFSLKELDIMTPFRFESAREGLAALYGLASHAMKGEIDRLRTVQLSDTIGIPESRTSETRGHGLAWSDWINRNKKEITTAISLKYTLLNSSRFYARLVVATLYGIGFVFLLLPSGEVFLHAIGLLRKLGLTVFR
jgi:hypothetical protein